MTKTVAIHQPNFFPWLGYFAKIATSDFFVFYDDVQFPKTGGTWSNRVKLLINSEPRWLTAAIDRAYQGTRAIHEMCFLEQNPWREKTIRAIELNYKKHPFYHESMDVVAPLLLSSENNIAEYNIHAVRTIVQHLGGCTGKLLRSSTIPHGGHSNQRLCSLTHALGADTYMCGGGADGYQDADVFNAAGIRLRYQAFIHPRYIQYNNAEFVPGLSIIDALMNVGAKETARLIGMLHE